MSIWDLAKPVIAQVHGYCLAGGSELATGCDLVYVAEDAQMGYPAVRFGVPDMHFHAWFLGMRTAMEMMLTGDSIIGRRGRRARAGPTGRSRPTSSTTRCSRSPQRIAKIAARARADQQARRAPPDGRHGAAGRHPRRHRAVRARHAHAGDGASSSATRSEKGLTGALQERDEPFGDYRTSLNRSIQE